MSSKAVATARCAPAGKRVVARELTLGDVPSLLQLESRRWTTEQSANADELARRIRTWPALSLGCFSRQTGQAWASLFMRPFDPADARRLPTWAAMVDASGPGSTRGLFGISFTSIHADAGDELFRFFWPRALRAGWQEIYLGAPMPGFAAAAAQQPGLTAERYARQTHRGLPRDAQLRYFSRRGFTELVAVKPGYFPHAGSADHGAILRGAIPWASWAWLWRRLPLVTLQSMTGLLPRGRHAF
jgi:hypothetical protein